MEISTAITTNSPKNISISFDLWKVIIEYLNDEDCGGGYGSILLFREANRAFSTIILECIREVRI